MLIIRQIFVINGIKPYSLREANLVLNSTPEIVKENVMKRILPEVKIQFKNYIGEENNYVPDYTESDIEKMVIGPGIPLFVVNSVDQLKIDKYSIINTFKISQGHNDERWMFLVYLNDKPTCFNFSVLIDSVHNYHIECIEPKGYKLAQLLHTYKKSKIENDIKDTYLLCARNYIIAGKKKDDKEIVFKGPTTMTFGYVPEDERFEIQNLKSYTEYPAEVVIQLLEKLKTLNDKSVKQ